MGSGTNAILICGSQMDVSTPTKRRLPLRVHLYRKNSPQTRGKCAMMPARSALHKWALHLQMLQGFLIKTLLEISI